MSNRVIVRHPSGQLGVPYPWTDFILLRYALMENQRSGLRTHAIRWQHLVGTHSRRCNWCRRLCRYYGMDEWKVCQRCQVWYARKLCCRIMNAVCSADNVDNIIALQILSVPEIWLRILEMICGKKRDIDMEVQQEIWLRVLKGPEPSEDHLAPGVHACDPRFWIPWTTPPHISKLWKFWMLDLTKGCQSLVARQCKHHRFDLRIILVIIAFLGPFSEFGLDDGIYWKRGPRAKRSAAKPQRWR